MGTQSLTAPTTTVVEPLQMSANTTLMVATFPPLSNTSSRMLNELRLLQERPGASSDIPATVAA